MVLLSASLSVMRNLLRRRVVIFLFNQTYRALICNMRQINLQIMKKASVQTIQSSKNIGLNPENVSKTQPLDKEKVNKIEAENHKPQNQLIQKAKDQSKQDKEESALKKIKSAQLFFNKKFLGNKDLSKALLIKNLLKAPKLLDSQQLIELKTGNLGQKIKEIQTIFKAQKKITKLKKSLPTPVMTDLELYVTKRDILKQKNSIIDQIRILYEEDKKKLEQKKNKKKRKFSTEEAEAKPEKPNKKQIPQKKQQPQPVTQTQSLPQLLFPGLYQEADSPAPVPEKPLENQDLNKDEDSEVLLLKKQEPTPVNLQPFDDDYFQRKFEEKIVKNKINVDTNFSLKSLFKSFDNRKTTLNQGEFIKHELNQIQHVAKATMENFQVKQKINKQLYGLNTDFDKIESQLTSKRITPAQIWVENGISTERKSINWIIKECDGFKKKFNVRKTKSLKYIKK